MDYTLEYQKWLDSPELDASDREELISLKGNDKEIQARFFAPLSFGTAGLRGEMGPGLSRMNIYVVRQATQGFADLIVSEGAEAMQKGVAICFDCRHHSDRFAAEAACVMAANGIRVRLFESMRPTPELSFAIRHYGMTAGINITASHNPHQYNGYKVYWSDGAQLPPQHADQVAKSIAKLDIFTGAKTMPYDQAVKDGLISLMGRDTDEAFMARVLSQSVRRDVAQKAASGLKIVYTPFHGTGYKLVPEVLRRLGAEQILCVPEQMIPDGDFPTVKSPNPEDKEGFALAIELAQKNDASLIIGTDPDADRVGIVVRDQKGAYQTLSGNQVGVLLLDYLIGARRDTGTMPEHPAAIKTIVTTEMVRAVGEQNGVSVFDTFTGFKFMAELIGAFEQKGDHQYIFAFEESYGYMVGDHTRDKDAVTASMLIAEMASWYHLKGMTLLDAMEALFAKYGAFEERTISLVMPGVDGLERMKTLMTKLRLQPPSSVAGIRVARVRDYLSGTIRALPDGPAAQMELSGSNVLYFELEEGTRFIVRPSGTEPKIKVYILTRGDTAAACRDTADRCEEFAKTLAR